MPQQVIDHHVNISEETISEDFYAGSPYLSATEPDFVEIMREKRKEARRPLDDVFGLRVHTDAGSSAYQALPVPRRQSES